MIDSPITYSQSDLTQIANYFPIKNTDWERKIFNTVKANIKRYYCPKQKQLCAYCQTELEHECHSEHIEHIVDKSFRPQWMFEPYNLALSCRQCNTYKTTKQVLTIFSRNAIVLPIGSRYYIICHPHFDEFDDHFELIDDLFIKAKNNYKGQNTIEICGLWRPLYMDRRARHLAIKKSDRSIKAAHHAQKVDIPTSERLAFLQYVDKLAAYL